MSPSRHNSAIASLSKLSTPQERLSVFDASAWFASRPDDLRLWIAQNAWPLGLAAGERLFARGDAASGMYFVAQGTIRITTSTLDGKEALLALAEAPLWFGEVGLFDEAPHEHDAESEGRALLLRVGQRALLDFLATHPSHWKSFGLLLAQRLRLAFFGIEGAALLPPTTRLARRLLAMARSYGDWKGREKMVIVVQQDQLGSMLSLSRQTVNKILKEFEVLGLLRRARGAVEIIDFQRFESFAESE
jgi:CRP/FNR family cyclic AMP-dependent transcriptional regulator